MQLQQAILEQWFARAVEAYAAETAPFLAGDQDPFRNPVGYTLRANLAVLLEQLLAGAALDTETVKTALEGILRVRAVQDLTASQAAGFVFALRPILRRQMPERSAALDAGIDQLALLAFEEYVRCREHLAQLRVNEQMRAVPPSLRAAGGARSSRSR